jgi:hypothetical protein
MTESGNWWEILRKEIKRNGDITCTEENTVMALIDGWLREIFPNVIWDNGVPFPHESNSSDSDNYPVIGKGTWDKNNLGDQITEGKNVINVIPGVHGAQCSSILVVKCIGRVQFKDRVRETIDSCIRCEDVRKMIIFFTNCWEDDSLEDEYFWRERQSTFKTFYNKKGIRFIKVLAKKKGGKPDITTTIVMPE